MTTQTTETVSAPAAPTPLVWKARDIHRLCQLPLDSDDATPARIEALITRLNDKVKNMPGDEEVVVTEEEDAILKDIQRCEGQG